jgi:hypothetical protein
VVWAKGAFIGQEAWLTGTRAGKRVFYRKVGNRWAKVGTKGIRPTATVADLAGPHGQRVIAVGSLATGGGHREATAWRLTKTGWKTTSVPAGVSRSALVAASVDGQSWFFAVGTDTARPPSKRGLIIRSK